MSKRMYVLGVILPTRGLVFTEVEMALSKNLEGWDYKIYRSSNLKIPECENQLVEEALRDDCRNLLFVEEDTVMPDNAINKMMITQSDIVCIDYGVSGYSCITRDKKTDEILWCGLGCTLVRANVFKKLEKPYFRSDKQLLLNYWPEIRWINAPRDAYGGQDIYFCIKAREKGFVIEQVDGECSHLKLDDLGKPGVNYGLHTISQKPIISKYQTL